MKLANNRGYPLAEAFMAVPIPGAMQQGPFAGLQKLSHRSGNMLLFIEGEGLTITLMQLLGRPGKRLIHMTEVAGIGPPRCSTETSTVYFMTANGLEQGIGGMGIWQL